MRTLDRRLSMRAELRRAPADGRASSDWRPAFMVAAAAREWAVGGGEEEEPWRCGVVESWRGMVEPCDWSGF